MPPSSAAAKPYSKMPDIMLGSRNTTGATIMPATAPIAAARPQPSASIHDTRMPTSRAESGLSAAARMASPSGVKRKNANRVSSTASITPTDPTSCAVKYFVANIESFGNGLGNDFSVCSKIQPDSALKISSRPMNTITLVSTGAFSTGRKIMRCSTSPAVNEIATVARNAAQYDQPLWINAQAMKVLNVAISPCAKLMWCVAW